MSLTQKLQAQKSNEKALWKESGSQGRNPSDRITSEKIGRIAEILAKSGNSGQSR
jgi:hypothetical protein